MSRFGLKALSGFYHLWHCQTLFGYCGSKALSRVIDKHDRDSMIYSDGAGAVIVEESA
jgi:hypothetical protein